jgi:hypothetical protein
MEPELADRLTGTADDPFYNDGKIAGIPASCSGGAPMSSPAAAERVPAVKAVADDIEVRPPSTSSATRL